MCLNLPPFEYFDYIVDRRNPRPPHRAQDVILTRPPKRKRRWLVLG